MSLINDIGSAMGSVDRWRTGTSVVPGQDDRSPGIPRDLAPAFRTSFQASISSVLDGVSRGDYEDPEIAARIDALQTRLRERALTTGAPPDAEPGGTGGATAAPDQPVTPDGPVTGGGPTGSGADAADQRELLDLQRQQAHARFGKVSSSVRSRFSGWSSVPRVAEASDLRTFKPATKAEAAAFAQRLAVELTEGAAKLEAVATELELARHDAQQGAAGAVGKVAKLEAEHAHLEQYVLDIAKIVDDQSNDSVSRSNAQAPTADMEAVVGEAVRNGIDAKDIDTLRKAVAIANEEATTGNSQSLNHMQEQLKQELISGWMRQQVRRDQERYRQEQRAYDDKRTEQRSGERRAQRMQDFNTASQRAAQRTAELVALYNQGAAERRQQAKT